MPIAGTIPHDFPHFATGPTLVRCVAVGLPYAMDLGYAEDRIQIQERPFWHEVKSDANGGVEGPPCDVQYLGSIAIVSCLLNRFNEDSMRLLASPNVNGEVSTVDPSLAIPPGTLPASGFYMRQDRGMCELWLLNKTYSLKYRRAFLRNSRQFTAGTRHQAFALAFECHVNDPCDRILFSYEDAIAPCQESQS